jgi:hypothetical protein
MVFGIIATKGQKSVGYKMSQQKWDFFGVEGTALRRLEERRSPSHSKD